MKKIRDRQPDRNGRRIVSRLAWVGGRRRLAQTLIATVALVGLPCAAAAGSEAGRSLDLMVTPTDFAHVALSWSPDGAQTYNVYRGQLLIASTTSTRFTDSQLWPGTTNSYTVTAVSPAGVQLDTVAASATTPSLPRLGFPRPYARSSAWNTPIGKTPAVHQSRALISYFVANAWHPNMTLRAWGVAVAEAQPGNQLFDVPCSRYRHCTLGAFGPIAIPVTAAPDPEEDGHLVVYDPSRGREWDMFQAMRSTIGWQATAGAALSMRRGNATIPAGHASADAANFPLLAGVVRPEEIAQGHIDHALVFTMPGVSSLGHVCPATHHDGSTRDPNALREGMRLQLVPAVNVAKLSIPAWEKTLARAMQKYGMYLRDQGGTLAIFAENPASRGYDAWKLAGMPDGGAAQIVGFPWSRFRVVAAPC